jgi:hypothetical protein
MQKKIKDFKDKILDFPFFILEILLYRLHPNSKIAKSAEEPKKNDMR